MGGCFKARAMSEVPDYPPSLDRLGTSRQDFFTALATLLGEVTQTLWISDYNLNDWGFDNPMVMDSLGAFLRSHETARLQVLMGDDLYLQAHAPRFSKLRQHLGHRIECRKAAPNAKFEAGVEGIVIADSRHILRRAAPPSFRHRLMLDAPEHAERLVGNYRHLWNESPPCLPGSPLGL
jgi:hypothetical protein